MNSVVCLVLELPSGYYPAWYINCTTCPHDLPDMYVQEGMGINIRQITWAHDTTITYTIFLYSSTILVLL